MIDANDVVAWYRGATTTELLDRANTQCRTIHGDQVYLRGLIEFTNHCVMDCTYCGIRAGNPRVHRYRLSETDIVELCKTAWDQGLRTFVLQGGEDPAFDPDTIARIVSAVQDYTQGRAAITLSIGIRHPRVYAQWKAAGAQRYLMRFETSDPKLYASLKQGASLQARLDALGSLRDLGFEVGSGYMVGLPGESEETRINNALLCHSMNLDMVGIGPFIPHPDTPLGTAPQEPLELVLRATALVRLLLPRANMPATTAAGSLDNRGRERMLAAGANVLMPNITPESVKKDYLLYPGKICLDESGFECINCLGIRTKLVSKHLSYAQGDSPSWLDRKLP